MIYGGLVSACLSPLTAHRRRAFVLVCDHRAASAGIGRKNSGRNHLSTFFEPPGKTEDGAYATVAQHYHRSAWPCALASLTTASTWRARPRAEKRDCFFAVADALPAFTDDMVNNAIYDKDYDADAAITALLGGECTSCRSLAARLCRTLLTHCDVCASAWLWVHRRLP